ncbi:hypothetical protein [Streptomyces sp. NPDC088766]|uniref:hypothetical protein n=1 Tax=Streptomyces sp. NPDC088766 TaxID=3365893 RepID=UPI003806C0DC
MKYLLNGFKMVIGLALVACYLAEVISELPYSIIAVALGGVLMVDGTRSVRSARRGKKTYPLSAKPRDGS